MAIFEYKALDVSGESVQGLIDADDLQEARSRLRQQGVYPTEVRGESAAVSVSKEISLSGIWRRISKREIALFTRQLATLLEAGLPLVEALSSLVDQLGDRALMGVVADVRERVKEGSSFSEAISEYPGNFSSLYINMVRAGEESGTLETILRRLSDHLEKEVTFRNKMRATLAYPFLMVLIGLGILFFLLAFIIPMVTRIFTAAQQVLPLPTRMLISLSSFMRDFWWLLFLIIAGLVLGIRWFIRTEGGRKIFDRFKLRLPLLGGLVQKMAVVRFSRTLGTLISSEAPLLKSLEIVKNVVDNSVFSQAIQSATADIGEGTSIAAPLKRSKVFPPLVIRMVSVGEESGNLGIMLFKVADIYDEEIETTVNALTSLIEPLIILVMGLIVGFIVLAILLPIFEMNQIIR